MVKVEQRTVEKDGRELQEIHFTVAVRAEDAVENQFGLMVDMLYQWQRQFGNSCGKFGISFVGTPQNHDGFMACLVKLIQQEEPLRPLFAGIGQIDVALMSPEGKTLQESELKIQ